MSRRFKYRLYAVYPDKDMPTMHKGNNLDDLIEIADYLKRFTKSTYIIKNFSGQVVWES